MANGVDQGQKTDDGQPQARENSGTILLVEDDTQLAALVCEYLTGAGYGVLHEADGHDVISVVKRDRPILAILDIMLPGTNGLDLCREIRSISSLPILMLTALGDDIDQIVGLEVGADDYLAKPVQPRLLLARIRALLRRSATARGHDRNDDLLNLGDLTIDMAKREVVIRNQCVNLTTAEFELLAVLARHRGRVLTRDALYRALRGIEYDGLDRSLDLRISRLRTKLHDTQHELIKSVHGQGYLLAVSS